MGQEPGATVYTCPNLVGESTEVDASVEGVPCRVLLDTGAQISLMSESFCQQLGLVVNPVDQLLKIKACGDHEVPYLGVVEANLIFGSVKLDYSSYPFLIVSDNEYNSDVPILIGTNVLKTITTVTDRDESLPDAWQTMMNILNVTKLNSFSAVLRSTKEVVIPPNSSVIVKGKLKSASSTIRSMRLSVLTERSDSLHHAIANAPATYKLDPRMDKHTVT